METMMQGCERRRGERKTIAEPELGIVFIEDTQNQGADTNGKPFFMGIYDLSTGGLQVESEKVPNRSDNLGVLVFDPAQRQWIGRQARVAWVKSGQSDKKHRVGLQYMEEVKDKQGDSANRDISCKPREQLLAAVERMLDMILFRSIPKHAVWNLLNYLTPRELKVGERFIQQGVEGRSLFIIQKGTCSVKVEKEKVYHHIARLGAGDVVGEMALLTGEPCSATVDAETDMIVWELTKEHYDTISSEYPDLRHFLTNLVTNRLETSPFIPDRLIGKYLIKYKLEHGAWSIVYKGVHTILNIPVAVKMLKHHIAMDPDFEKRFENEAKIVARLNHKNIVQVYDIEKCYQTQFIIMEYLEGETLEKLLKWTGTFTVMRALHFLVQICSGLAYAHEKGVIHKDIKPANILVQSGNQIKILDFGLACSSGIADMPMEGTIYYMAPEQVEGEAVDARTDIYSLGIVAYEMITGRRPFPEEDLLELTEMITEQEIPDPKILAPGIPETLRRYIITSCRKNPEERYQSMNQIMADLHPLYQELFGDSVEEKDERGFLSSLFCLCKDSQRRDLNQLIEEFSLRAQGLGITIRVADHGDLLSGETKKQY